MKRSRVLLVTITVAMLSVTVSPEVFAGDMAKAVVIPKAELKWNNAGIPGVSNAVVDGDMAKGPSRFYLRYAVGLVTPLHHHSPDHYVTTVSGTLVLHAGGKDHRLGPGSYFALTGKAPHVARCEGSEDCVMFIAALGPWDVVPEK